MAASPMASLNQLARERRWDVTWRTNGLCAVTGWPIIVVELSARRKPIASASVARSRGLSISDAREMCAGMALEAVAA